MKKSLGFFLLSFYSLVKKTFIYRYHGDIKAVSVFVLGLLNFSWHCVKSPNPAKKRRENEFLSFIYRYHDNVVSGFCRTW